MGAGDETGAGARPEGGIGLEDTLAGLDTPPAGSPSVPSAARPRAPTSRETPRSHSGTDEALAAERQRELDRQEHVAHVLRFRAFMLFIIPVWVSFGVVDWLVATFIARSSFLPFVLLRGGFALWLGFITWRTHARPLVGPREFLLLDMGTFIACSAVIAGMGFWYAGIASPYFAGVLLALLVRSAMVALPWRVGLLQCGLITLTYPTVFGVAALGSPWIRGQFGDPQALAMFIHNLSFLAGGLLFIVIGGHVTWRLRRQVFETRSIGRYRLRKRIGHGGMGEVWAAHDETLKRDVALKILRSERATAEWVQRFHREVHATAELTHIHTVRIFDYGTTDDGLWYYAMELLEGETLRARVAQKGPLPAALVRRFAADVAGALAEAHARGIVHRDLKPENLFVAVIGGERDVIKLLDFGLAKTTQVDDGLTKSGWVGGTPAYMSPEVAAGQAADARADVYSFGASLYYALTARAPFAADNLGALLQAHLRDEAQPPSMFAQGVPADLERLVMRCLAKDPAARPKDGGELVALLAAAAK